MFASLLVLALVAIVLSRPAITTGVEPSCGLAEHAHGIGCFDEAGALVCLRREHAHAATCYPDGSAEAAVVSSPASEADEQTGAAGDGKVDAVDAASTPANDAPEAASLADASGAPGPETATAQDTPSAGVVDGTPPEGAKKVDGTPPEGAGEAEGAVATANGDATPMQGALSGADSGAEPSGAEEQQAPEGVRTLTATSGACTVELAFDEGAGLTPDTALALREIGEESEEYASYRERALTALGIGPDEAEAYEARFFDITLSEGDMRIEPRSPVRVTLAGDLPAGETAQVVHFGEEGVELIEAQLVKTGVSARGVASAQDADDAADEVVSAASPDASGGPEASVLTAQVDDAALAYTFEQASFSVTGLLVKSPDVATNPPSNKELAKKRSLSEIEAGATYVIYAVINGTPYAIGRDGAFYRMMRTGDGNNLYSTAGTSIYSSYLWTVNNKVTQPDGFKAKITNVMDPSIALYPRTAGGSVVENGSSKAYVRTAGKDAEFYIYDNGGNLGIRSDGSDSLYVGQAGATPKTLYFAEVASEANYSATQITTSPLLEGYYLISRSPDAEEGTQDVTAMRYDLKYRKEAYGVGYHQVRGFLNDAIWYVKPTDDGRYVVRNLWSGERLSPIAGSTDDTLSIEPQNGGYYWLKSTNGKGLKANNIGGYGLWDKGPSNYTLYRVDGDGFYHAYFDASMGNKPFYRYTANSFASHVQYTLDDLLDDGVTPCHTLNLPTADEVGTTGSASSAQPYRYRLNGWYDVYGHAWYPPGASVTVTGNAVFYPDWVAASYDVGQAQDLSAKSVYMPAITTSIFDYNELMNLGGLRQLSSAEADVSATAHDERWEDTLAADSFLFIFNDGQQKHSLHNVNGSVRAPWNSSHSQGSYNGNYNGIVTAGILGQNPGLAARLFDPATEAMGKTYVGTDHNLYSYDYDTGYYYYDSNRNAASYNQSDGRFYVYDYTNRTDKSNRPNVSTFQDKTDFLPLNYGNQEFSENAGDVNYWFGMKTEFYFFLPNDATTDGSKNKSIKGDDLAFRFSGDDDVWVLVDDQLVLDLGGVHGTVYGEIDFSTSSVTTGQYGAEAVYEFKDGGSAQIATEQAAAALASDQIKAIGVRDNGEAVIEGSGATVSRVTSSVNDVLASLSAGNHKLTFLYLERGSSESNAAIYFNIAPVYQVNLTKVDGTAGGHRPLEGATFKVYTDAACTQEADYITGRRTTSYDAQRGFLDTDGSYYFDGFVANQDYYLKEIETPPGYRPLSGPIRVSINGTTNTCTYLPTFEDGSQGEQVVCVAQLEAQGTDFSSVYGGFAIEVPNYSGREIPAAGGPGTQLCVVAGACLCVAACVLLWLRGRERA